MKTIRSLMILAGLSAVLLALGVPGAKAQRFPTTSFSGTFGLPLEAQWGAMTLPAGEYTLEYGLLNNGHHLVVVGSATKGRPLGVILAGPRNDASARKNALVCIREGDALIVRALELPAIGESIHFKIPHVVAVRSRVIAGHQNEKGFTRVASVAVRIEPVPVH